MPSPTPGTYSPNTKTQTTLTINNAVQLSESKRFEVAGNICTRIIQEKTYTFEVVLSDIGIGDSKNSSLNTLQNQGVTVTALEQIISAYAAGSYNSKVNLVINGEATTDALITGFELISQNINTKSYQYKITYSTVKVGDKVSEWGSYYADIKAAGIQVPIESISESTSVSRSENSTSVTKQVDIQIDKSMAGSISDLVDSIGDKIFEYDEKSGLTALVPSLNFPSENSIRDSLTAAYKRYKTKKLDKVNGSCSITSTLEFANKKNTFSHQATVSLQANSVTEVTASEQGVIKLLLKSEVEGNNVKSTLQSKYDSIESEIKERLKKALNNSIKCSFLIFDETSDPWFESEELSFDTLAAELNYSVSIIAKDNNDITASPGVRHKVVEEITKSNGEIITSKKGSIISSKGDLVDNTKTGLARFPRFKNAFDYFSAAGKSKIVNSSNTKIGMTAHSQTLSPMLGTIEWTVSFSDLEIYNESDFKYKSFNVSVNENKKIPDKNVFNVIKTNPIVQLKGYSTLHEAEATCNIVIRKGYFDGNAKSAYDDMSAKAKAAIEDEIESKLSGDIVVNSLTEQMNLVPDYNYSASVSASAVSRGL